MSTPIYNKQNSSGTTGIFRSRDVSKLNRRWKNTHNNFNLSHRFFETSRMADITPHLVVRGVIDGRYKVHCGHESISPVTDSPVMSDINMKIANFMVPYKAIMPNTWDIFYKQPHDGDDVNTNVVATSLGIYNSVAPFMPLTEIAYFIRDSYAEYSPSVSMYDVAPVAEDYQNLFRTLRMHEMIFGKGSLLTYLGLPLHSVVNADKFSNMYRDFCSYLVAVQEEAYDLSESAVFWLTNNQEVFVPTADTTLIGKQSSIDFGNVLILNQRFISYSRFFELLADSDYNFAFSSDIETLLLSINNVVVNYDFLFTQLMNGYNLGLRGAHIDDLVDSPASIRYITSADSTPNFFPAINIDRVYAYQLVCSQFFSNSKIDAVYNSDTWFNGLRAILVDIGDSKETIFSLDGNDYYYDLTSVNTIARAFSRVILPYDFFKSKYDLLCYIFDFRDSLKFGDYFTSAKTRPLTLGNVVAPLTGDGVSAVDTTISIARQRFFNWINNAEDTIESYVNTLFGRQMPLDLTVPRFLSLETVPVSSKETTNTADEQGKLTSRFRSESGRFAFSSYMDSVPGIILGVHYYESERIYSRAMDKFAFKENRFDYFNPMLQKIGDQPIDQSERSYEFVKDDTPFAYTLRFMEYKQMNSRAVGGFVGSLPSYAFIVDNGSSGDAFTNENLSSEYIRQRNSEYDRFFPSLTSFLPSERFHVINKWSNRVEGVQPMAWTSEILF